MRSKFTILQNLLLFSLLAIVACKKESETYNSDAVADYYPLSSGKYITYRVDSTVFTNFGTSTEVHSYQVKHVLDAQITDNLGRPSYRVYRYIRDLAGTQPWTAAGSFIVTSLEDQVEVNENNLRFVKLHLPIKQDYSWKGNRYLPTEPYQQSYLFENDNDMGNWDYTYQNTNDVFSYKQQSIPNVLNIVQVDSRIALDTVDVVNNTATIPKNSTAVYLRGNASDTIRITASKPDFANYYKLVIYNQSNFHATLSGIIIPPLLGLSFEYSTDLLKWYYPNPLTVVSNAVNLPRVAFTAYLFGTASGNITVNTSTLDTTQVKVIQVYNKSNFPAFCNFNATMNAAAIPPGYGRGYELYQGNWRYSNNANVLLNKDPYIEGLAFGSTTYSVEKYAKTIGLVYKELLMWEYQPNTSGVGGHTTGFGIKMTMIDHN